MAVVLIIYRASMIAITGLMSTVLMKTTSSGIALHLSGLCFSSAVLSVLPLEFVSLASTKGFVSFMSGHELVLRTRVLLGFVEWNVSISLLSHCLSSYHRDDNSDIVATDTMNNTVYVKAKECGDQLSVEEFAILRETLLLILSTGFHCYCENH